MIDQELLKRARAFERQALAEIYDRWSPGLYRYSIRMLGDDGLAEECVADVFNRFLEALKGGRGPRDFLQAYLYRMAHNWITDFYRKKALPEVPLEAELKGEAADEPPEVVARNLERTTLRRALLQLTPDQRQVILLKYVEEWENDQIAVALNKPVGAVKSLQHRALEALRRNLKMQAQDYDEEEFNSIRSEY